MDAIQYLARVREVAQRLAPVTLIGRTSVHLAYLVPLTVTNPRARVSLFQESVTVNSVANIDPFRRPERLDRSIWLLLVIHSVVLL